MSKKKKNKKPYEPEKDTGQKAPVRVRIAAGDVNDKYSSYPSSGLTPVRLAHIFRAADEGDVLLQMELFEDMEEKDTHLFSQLQTRKLAVTGLDWEVQPYSEGELDKEIAVFVEKELNGLERLNDIFMDMLDAVGKGISIQEIDWGIRDGFNVIRDIEWVHPKKLVWDSITDELKICTGDFPAGVEFPRNKFVIHKYKAKSGHDSRAGILRVISWMYLFKNYTLKDWVSFCEVFGMPIRLGKYSQAASEDDKRRLMEAIYMIGTDAAGIIPDSAVIEFIESNKTTSAEIYERLARYCDEQISKAVLGQTLTADSGGGSYAQGKVHNDVRKDLTVADAKALAATVRRDIIGPLVEYNFGPGVSLPKFEFDCQEAEDLKETIEIYRTLACDMGLKIPSQHVYEKFNIPKPKEGEELLEAKTGGRVLPADSQTTMKEGVTAKKADVGQEQIDRMAEQAKTYASKSFEKMFRPILDRLEQSDDLGTFQEALKDREQLRGLYQEMNETELEDLIVQGLYLSELIGRAALDEG